MTTVGDPSWIIPEEFEGPATLAAARTDSIRLELIDGRIRSKNMPDGDRGRIRQWLTRVCVRHDPDLWLHPDQGIKVQGRSQGRARPDGCLASADAFVGQGEWAESGGVLMAVQVTAYDREARARDRVEKPRAYAETGIPVYLLVDRDTHEVLVHSEPDGARYESVRIVPFGKDVTLPDPVGITLDTEPLKDWVR